MRLLLFLGTNIGVLVVISVVMKVFGLEEMLLRQGVQYNFNGLLIMSAVIGMSGSFISLLLSKSMAKRGTRAHVIDQPGNDAEAWLVETVAKQAEASGIKMPEVAIYDAPDVNAFATGWNKNAALVAVSTGLLRSMQRDEVEAVLAHEVSHVANGDMVTLSLIQGVVNTFVIFLSRVVGIFVDRVVFRSERGFGPGYFITSIVSQILLGILATAVVMWFSRWREFRADAGGANLAGRGKMIAALERLKQSGQPPVLPESMEAFGISQGFRRGIGNLFRSHPPLDERIAALREAT
jgi:heat shock protein HtpX